MMVGHRPKKVGIIGIGGLRHLALQFANAMGCEVTALSSSPSKEKEAKELGAHHFLLSKKTEELIKAANSFDLLLSSSTHGVDWELYLSILRPKGKLCLLGALEQELQTNIMNLVGGSKMVCGSNIGSRPGIKKMLEFAALHNIRPKIEIYPMKEVNEAIEKLKANKIRYRAVSKNG